MEKREVFIDGKAVKMDKKDIQVMFVKLIHADHGGYICFPESEVRSDSKQKIWRQDPSRWVKYDASFGRDALPDSVNRPFNQYLTINTFGDMRNNNSIARTKANVSNINGFLIDIDYHEECSYGVREEMINKIDSFLQELIQKSKLPCPNTYVLSGRGVGMLYLFKDFELSEELKVYHEACAKKVGHARFKEIWKNYSIELSELKAGDGAIINIKEQAENAMYQGVSRTERISVMDSGDYTDDSSVKNHLQVDANDINSYIQMAKLLSATDSRYSLPVDYVKSCPYLMSFMKKYKIKEQIEKYYTKHPEKFGNEKQQNLLWLNRSKINKYDELPKTNARLEALKEKAFINGAEKYMWVPPSRPYYEMRGAYKNSKGFSKILVFSAWEMVPRMIGAMVSYEAERLTVGKLVHQSKNQDKKNTGYFAEGSRRYPVARLRFNVSNGEVRGMSLFALLYPSKTMSDMYAPVTSLNKRESLEQIEKSVRLALNVSLLLVVKVSDFYVT